MPSNEQKHHHSLKNIFRKDRSPSVGSESGKESSHGSHIGLSKIFHHHGEAKGDSGISRTPSLLSMKKQNLNITRSLSNIENDRGAPKKLSKAETMAHLLQMKKNNAARSVRRGPEANATPNSGGNGSTPPSSTSNSHHHQEKIKYNPFGINKSPSAEHPSTSFYLSGGPNADKVLSNPVADPNDFLPPDLHQEHINLLEDFEIDLSTKKLGDGGSSDVRIINAVNHKKKMYALKKFTLLDKESDAEFYKRATKEFIISKKAAHSRHVVDTLIMVRIQSQANLTRGWGIVLEYCAGGDLFNAIVKPGWKRSPLSERYCIFKQIAYGVKYLHDLGISHKDLKPENVLIDANGIAKLCDFGVSAYGNEIDGDLNSPVRLSTAYVGSPPYSPPEVMKLKECSHSEVKNWAYDPYKMDCWGLGMLLFCIVYCNVPFSSASSNEHGFRDYKFNHNRYASDHPTFKNNTDFCKGPGTEFRWAQQFNSTGAARVAWKLCDPSVNNRYTLDLLFKDPWFTGLEMCIYEHPNQEVDPIVHQSGSSRTSSVTNSQAPSRKATIGSNYESDELHTPFRSMLDLAGFSPGSSLASKFQDHDYRDDESVHSASSFTHTPLKLRKDDRANSFDRALNRGSYDSEGENISEHSGIKRSMVEVGEDANSRDLPPSATNLTSLKEDQMETFHDKPASSAGSVSSRNGKHLSENNELSDDKETATEVVPELNDKVLKPATDLNLDSSGMCELGYKIKKHNHVGISNVSVSGSLSRKR